MHGKCERDTDDREQRDSIRLSNYKGTGEQSADVMADAKTPPKVAKLVTSTVPAAKAVRRRIPSM